MSRPRLLYVPIATAMEAERFIALVDWADVASFDAPGAGANRDSSPRGVAGVVEAALARLDELGWDRFAVVADSHGQAAGVDLIAAHPERVSAAFIAHAAARYGIKGERTAMVPALHEAAGQLLETDYRSFARAITQMTLGLIDDEWIEKWIEQVPQRVCQNILGDLSAREPELAVRLAGLDIPVVIGQHAGCVMWTPESFEDARAALPAARAIVCDGIPTLDPRFIAAVREITTTPPVE